MVSVMYQHAYYGQISRYFKVEGLPIQNIHGVSGGGWSIKLFWENGHWMDATEYVDLMWHMHQQLMRNQKHCTGTFQNIFFCLGPAERIPALGTVHWIYRYGCDYRRMLEVMFSTDSAGLQPNPKGSKPSSLSGRATLGMCIANLPTQTPPDDYDITFAFPSHIQKPLGPLPLVGPAAYDMESGKIITDINISQGTSTKPFTGSEKCDEYHTKVIESCVGSTKCSDCKFSPFTASCGETCTFGCHPETTACQICSSVTVLDRNRCKVFGNKYAPPINGMEMSLNLALAGTGAAGGRLAMHDGVEGTINTLDDVAVDYGGNLIGGVVCSHEERLSPTCYDYPGKDFPKRYQTSKPCGNSNTRGEDRLRWIDGGFCDNDGLRRAIENNLDNLSKRPSTHVYKITAGLKTTLWPFTASTVTAYIKDYIKPFAIPTPGKQPWTYTAYWSANVPVLKRVFVGNNKSLAVGLLEGTFRSDLKGIAGRKYQMLMLFGGRKHLDPETLMPPNPLMYNTPDGRAKIDGLWGKLSRYIAQDMDEGLRTESWIREFFKPETKPPTDSPIEQPTKAPTNPPTNPPTHDPTHAPTDQPTDQPTEPPTQFPSSAPTYLPTSSHPTSMPSGSPSSSMPSLSPSHSSISSTPTAQPTTAAPSLAPTASTPTNTPTDIPTPSAPTQTPTVSSPTVAPSVSPTTSPSSSSPTTSPSGAPSTSPLMADTARLQESIEGVTIAVPIVVLFIIAILVFVIVWRRRRVQESRFLTVIPTRGVSNDIYDEARNVRPNRAQRQQKKKKQKTANNHHNPMFSKQISLNTEQTLDMTANFRINKPHIQPPTQQHQEKVVYDFYIESEPPTQQNQEKVLYDFAAESEPPTQQHQENVFYDFAADDDCDI